MKQSRMTKRLLAVMMSFLMAFSSVQGYIKAEDLEKVIDLNTNDPLTENEKVDSDFSVDSNVENTEPNTDEEIEKDDVIESETEQPENSTNSDAVEGATGSDIVENATDSDVNQATGSDVVEEATPSDVEQIIVPETDYEWESIEGAQINGSMNMRFFYRNAALPTGEAGKDVSSEIEITAGTVTIDGKKLTEDAEFDIYENSSFTFDFEWKAIDSKKTFNPGDSLNIKIGTIKGLSYKKENKKESLYISNVKVGSYYLKYENNVLEFHIDFSDNISYFENLAGFYKGSSSFSNVVEEEVIDINFMDSITGKVNVLPKPVQPAKPSTGIGWSAEIAPSFKYDRNTIQKGRKRTGDIGNEIQYMVGFFDLVKRYEQGEALNFEIYNDVIIEDELDANQAYILDKYDYGQEAPFFLEIPVFYYGTNNAVEYRGQGNGHVVIGNGEATAGATRSTIRVTGDNFTHITEGDIEALVNETPRSWGIVETQMGTQKLIVNVGKLGSLNQSEAITMNDINDGWDEEADSNNRSFKDIVDIIESKRDNAKLVIQNYEEGKYTPKDNLKDRLEIFKTFTSKESDKVKEYVEAVESFIENPIGEPPVLKELIDFTDKKKEQAYSNLTESLKNYVKDIEVFDNNKDAYIQTWVDVLALYEKTLEYYDLSKTDGDFPIYGFILRYSTRVTNLSQTIVSNKVEIRTGLLEYEKSVNVKHNFTAGIKGNYVNGDVVLVKADSRYSYNEENLGNTTVNGMEGVKFQVFKEGSETPIKFMKAELNDKKQYLYIDGNHEGDSNFTDVLVTDSKGTIALSSLPTNVNYYFKEVGTVDGYYGNQNQKIEFQVDKNKVTYKLAENVSRAITLKKVDAETKLGLEGVTFAIYNKENDVELTGFTKDGDVYLYDGKGNAELKTVENGNLEVRNLPAGEFYMKETKALDGYKPLDGNANYFPFTLSEDLPVDGGVIIKINGGLDILNTKEELPEFKASLKVIKKGDDGNLLKGVEFNLYKALNDEFMATYVTNDNGEIMIDDLAIGNYYLVEVKGADGYNFDSTKKYDVVINGENASIEKVIVNNKKVIPPTPSDPFDPDRPEVEIPDEDVPLGPTEEIVEIEDEDVPLSDGGDNAFVEIEDEDVPLDSGVPNTGDNLYFWLPMMLISMVALGFLNVLRRRFAK